MRIRIRDPESFLPWIQDLGSGMEKYGSAALIYNTVNGLGVTGWWEKVCGGWSAYNKRQPGLIIKLIYCKLVGLNTCFLYFLLITGIILLKTLGRKVLSNRMLFDVQSSTDFLDFLSCCTFMHTHILHTLYAVQCTVHYHYPVSSQKTNISANSKPKSELLER